MAWVTSVQLIVVGVVAALVFLMIRVRGPDAVPIGRPSTAWIWLALAMGFAYLGADEFLGIHERIDEFVAASLSLGMTQPPVVLTLGLIVGAPLAFLMWRDWTDNSARLWLAFGFLSAVLAVGMDYVDSVDLGRLDAVRRAGEDCLELLVGGGLLLAITRVLLVTAAADSESDATTGPTESLPAQEQANVLDDLGDTARRSGQATAEV